jgi:hypothetical protein
LLKESARLSSGNNPAKPVVDKMIVDLARTAEGQKYILNAFAKNEIEPLITTQAGKTAIIETVQTMLRDAAARTSTLPAEVLLKDKKGVDRLVAISALVADANHAKLDVNTLSLAKARSFLELAAQSEKVISLIAPKNLAKLEQKKTETAKAKAGVQKAKPGMRKPVDLARTVRPRAELRSLLQELGESKLSIPAHLYSIIEKHYAGLAGIKSVSDNKVLPAYEITQTPEESRANSVLRNILQVMEARATSGVAKVMRDAQAPAIAAKLTEEESRRIVRGMIIVKAKADEDTYRQIADVLAQKGYFKPMAEEVQADNKEGVERFIDNVVLEARKIVNNGELTEEALLQAIETIERQAQPVPLAA